MGIKKGEKFLNWGGKDPKETKRKIGLAVSIKLKGRIVPKEIRRKLSKTVTGWPKTEVHKKNLSKSLKGRKHSPERIAAIVEGLKNACLQCKQTTPELKVDNFLSEFYRGFKLNWEYVGNKKFWVMFKDGAHKNPDFVNKREMRAIEVFGDYWHRNDNPSVLVRKYKEIGWKCLVLWEREVNVSLVDDYEHFMGYKYYWEEG